MHKSKVADVSVADIGGTKEASPRLSPIVFHFMQFSAKIMPNNRLAPPPPPGVGVHHSIKSWLPWPCTLGTAHNEFD